MQHTKLIIAPQEAIVVSESSIHMTIQAITNVLKVLDDMEFYGLFLASGMSEKAAKRRAEKVYSAKRQCRLALDAIGDDTQDALCYIAN